MDLQYSWKKFKAFTKYKLMKEHNKETKHNENNNTYIPINFIIT